MGTRASLVHAVVVHGRLFGLLVLHSARPSFVCYDVRQGLATFAESVSLVLEKRFEMARHVSEVRGRELHFKVLSRVNQAPNRDADALSVNFNGLCSPGGLLDVIPGTEAAGIVLFPEPESAACADAAAVPEPCLRIGFCTPSSAYASALEAKISLLCRDTLPALKEAEQRAGGPEQQQQQGPFVWCTEDVAGELRKLARAPWLAEQRREALARLAELWPVEQAAGCIAVEFIPGRGYLLFLRKATRREVLWGGDIRGEAEALLGSEQPPTRDPVAVWKVA
eukprot:tig00021070_g17879.t1